MDALAPKYIDTRPQQKCVFPSALYKLWWVNLNDENTSLMFSADLLVSYFSNRHFAPVLQAQIVFSDHNSTGS